LLSFVATAKVEAVVNVIDVNVAVLEDKMGIQDQLNRGQRSFLLPPSPPLLLDPPRLSADLPIQLFPGYGTLSAILLGLCGTNSCKPADISQLPSETELEDPI